MFLTTGWCRTGVKWAALIANLLDPITTLWSTRGRKPPMTYVASPLVEGSLMSISVIQRHCNRPVTWTEEEVRREQCVGKWYAWIS